MRVTLALLVAETIRRPVAAMDCVAVAETEIAAVPAPSVTVIVESASVAV